METSTHISTIYSCSHPPVLHLPCMTFHVKSCAARQTSHVQTVIKFFPI
jgi:hypothetical protein